jgi:tRNA 2-thiocytidine biosynthesis protein TtcA
MNLTGAGKMLAMPMLLHYDKYPVSLIRPLGYVDEGTIAASANENGLLKAACTCPYGANSGRRGMKAKIAAFLGQPGAAAEKRRILAALDGAGLL